MSRFKKFLIVLAGCLVVSGSTALALTATDFYQEAATWSYQNCRSVSDTNRLNNTICFLLKNQSDNQIALALQNNNNIAQQQSISGLQQNSKKVKVYDSNGVYLGVALTPFQENMATAQVFNTDLQKIIQIGTYAGESGFIGRVINVSYAGPNCTGDTYIKTGGDLYMQNRLNDRILVSESTIKEYWVLEDNPSIQYVQIKSLKNGNSCQSDDSLSPTLKLNSVNMSLPSPVAMPLDYRYE